MDNLFMRHSVRRFKNTEVEPEKIEKLVKAGMAAPTAGNQQESRFIVVTDRDLLEKLSKCSPYAGCAAKAPLAIVPVADLNGAKFPEFWQQDLAAAMENILVEAVSLDLGGVWLGAAPLEERTDYLTEMFGAAGKYQALRDCRHRLSGKTAHRRRTYLRYGTYFL